MRGPNTLWTFISRVLLILSNQSQRKNRKRRVLPTVGDFNFLTIVLMYY